MARKKAADPRVLEEFGKWFTMRYKELGYTRQADFTSRMQEEGRPHVSSVSRWLNGREVPTEPVHMAGLARVLGVPLLELYVRTGAIPEEDAHYRPPEREPMHPEVARLMRLCQEVGLMPEPAREEANRAISAHVDGAYSTVDLIKSIAGIANSLLPV